MNNRLLLRYLGLLLLPVAGAMLLCLLLAFTDMAKEHATGAIRSLSISAAITALSGLILIAIGGKQTGELLRKEAIALVGLVWLLAAAFGALPYLLVEEPLTLTEAYFESMSGYTTTGSTVLTDIEAWPNSIIFYRSLTQWLGGVGILVLFVGLLSAMGTGSGRTLFQQESSVNASASFGTRAKDKANRLWQIYLVLSAVCFLGLVLLGLDPFEAAIHMFSTVATGGFSSRNASIGHFANPWIEWWLIIFMVLGGISFVLMAWLSMRRWDRWQQEEETKAYLWILGIAATLIAIDLFFAKTEMGFFETLRTSLFQTVSIMTSTGFVTANYDQWPTASRLILLLLIFIGGCAGSTAGGMKVRRILIFVKSARQQLIGAFRPNQVFTIRIGGNAINEHQRNQTLFFIGLTGLLFAICTILIGAFEPGLDLVSVFSSVAATLLNTGPGLGAVGPTSNFAEFSPASQMVFAFAMALGRLEFFAILVLLLPELWRHY